MPSSPFLDVKHSWPQFNARISDLVKQEKCKRILEIGAGKNPYFKPEFISENNLSYTIVDVDVNLKRNDNYYKSVVVDLTQKTCDLGELEAEYDLIFSRMVLEHIENPEFFHTNTLRLLQKDGFVFHFFATKYSVHTIFNLVLPEFLTDFLVFSFQTRYKKSHNKYKAYYKWCYGPTKKNRRRLENIGYRILEYKGFVGHHYMNRYRILDVIENGWNKLLVKIQSPLMCSNAFFLAVKTK